MLEECVIIGISGYKRAGKTTIARYLSSRYGFIPFAFADPLYDGLQAMFGLNFRDDYWQNDKDRIVPGTGRSLRQLLQTLGTEWGQQQLRRDVWVYRAEMRIRQFLAVMGSATGWLPCIVLTDVRETAEAEWVRQHGTLIRVSNSRTYKEDDHSSENGIPDALVDHTIPNEGSIPGLHSYVDALIGVLSTGRP